MSDLNKDLANKFLEYLDNKQFERLQFEAEMLGDIENQHPLIMFYYASSIYLRETSKEKELLYASSLFEKVHTVNNNHLQSLYNMIAVSFKTKSFKNVLPLVLKAYEKNKKDVKLIEGLARINFYLGNRKESISFFRELYKMLPEKIEGRLPFVSSLNYTSGISQDEYMNECLKFSSLIEKKLQIKNNNFKFDFKNKKIKIAFLSADLKTHSVSHFLKDLLKKIDKSKFEIILVSNLLVYKQDSLSEVLKNSVDMWYDVENYSDEDLTTFLRSQNLDILIDLNGFTTGNRFEVLARRCAKIQIEWLGYNNSLGIKNMDYLISDKHLIYPDEEKSYSEEICYMPKIWNALSPPENLPDIDDKSKLNIPIFTFCSFNNFQKLSDRTISVWSQILNNSQSQILLKDSLVGGEDIKNNIIKKFINKGVNERQIIFLSREKRIIDHLKHYNRANVALDTFPYPGVTTSCEAILMGLPVLTMKGFNLNSRCGESINKNINMEHLIANDDQDYIKIAKSLMIEDNLSKDCGLKLRQKALTSPLFDTDDFTKNFEKLMKEIYSKI